MLLRRARTTAVRRPASCVPAAWDRLRPGPVDLEWGRVGMASAILGDIAGTCAPASCSAGRISASTRLATAGSEVLVCDPPPKTGAARFLRLARPGPGRKSTISALGRR
jgi:hypothetical protein